MQESIYHISKFEVRKNGPLWGVYDAGKLRRQYRTLRDARKFCLAPKPNIFVIVEGGIVQDIVCDDLAAIGRCFVVDYDVQEDNAGVAITQDDGGTAFAGCTEHVPCKPAIDLQQVIRGAE